MDKWQCIPCGYIYDPAVGDDHGNIKPGTNFENIFYNWICPECGLGKEEFEKI